MPDIKKNIKYQKEQQQVLEKILNILNFNKDYVFYLYDLDNNEQIQNDILLLTDDIKKFYPSSCCRGINSKDCKRPYLCIIRFILKYHEKELFYSDSTYIIDENKKIRTKKYKILNN